MRRIATIHTRATEELEQLVLYQRARTDALVAKFDAVLEIVGDERSDAEVGPTSQDHVLLAALSTVLVHAAGQCPA
ncbi:MAG: hypothetical protein ABI988_03895 [Nitrospirota bacterium]